MTSRTHRRFWHEFNRLPAHVQCLAREKFQLWLRDPFHPSMQFKPLVGNVWSVRIGDHYRAVAQKARRSRRLVLDRHARRLQQLHQAVAVAAELFGQRLAGATDCGGRPSLLRCYLRSFTFYLGNPFELDRVPAPSPLPSRFYLLYRASARSISVPEFLISFSSWSSCAPW